MYVFPFKDLIFTRGQKQKKMSLVQRVRQFVMFSVTRL